MLEHVDESKSFSFSTVIELAQKSTCLKCKKVFEPMDNYYFVVTGRDEFLMWHRYGFCIYPFGRFD